MRAVKCPVCNGSGKYEKKTCHGCNGKGWVEVTENYPPYPWYPDPWKSRKPWETGSPYRW